MKQLNFTEINVAELISSSRIEAGMTKSELAKASGVSIAAISRYEDGSRTPTAEILSKILLPLGKNVAIW